MKTVIYIDVLLIMNVIMTYLLLLIMCSFCKICVKGANLLYGSLLGSVYSLVILIPPIHSALQILLKTAMCISIVCITFKPKSIRVLCRYSTIFLLVNALLAGLVLLLQNVMGSRYIYSQNGAYYMDIDVKTVILITTVLYVIIRFSVAVFENKKNSAEISRIQIFIDGVYVEVNAISDTGNRLYEPVTGYPVAIVQFEAVKRLFPPEMIGYLQGKYDDVDKISMFYKSKMSIVHAHFAVGDAVLPAFRPDHILIYNNNKKYRINDCVIAVTTNALSDGSFQMLLHPDLVNNAEDSLRRLHKNVANH